MPASHCKSPIDAAADWGRSPGLRRVHTRRFHADVRAADLVKPVPQLFQLRCCCSIGADLLACLFLRPSCQYTRDHNVLVDIQSATPFDDCFHSDSLSEAATDGTTKGKTLPFVLPVCGFDTTW